MTLNQKLSDETVARLLSGRNAPSVLERERQFERIFAAIEADSKPARRYFRPFAFALGGSLCVLALLLLRRPAVPEFAARGGPAPSGVAFRPLCAGASDAHCKQGSALAFEVTAGAELQYFAAFAQRPDGAVVWYFPEANGVSVRLDRNASSPVLDRGARLGNDEPPGHYELYGVFSKQPLTRAQIKSALGADLQGTNGVNVLRRSFEVEP